MTAQNLDRDRVRAELRHCMPGLSRRYGVSRLGLFGSFARIQAEAVSV